MRRFATLFFAPSGAGLGRQIKWVAVVALMLVWGDAGLHYLDIHPVPMWMAPILRAALVSVIMLALAGIFLRGVRDRERAYREARVSSERFSKIFFASPIAYILVRADTGRYIAVNPACEALTGRSAHDMVGRTALELGIYADVAERDAFVAELNAKNRADAMPFRLRTGDGTIMTVEQSAVRFESADGMFTLTSLVDVSNREQLAESEGRFAKMFDASPTAYVLTKRDSAEYVAFNPAFEKLTGYTKQELREKSAAELGIYDAPEERRDLLERLEASPNGRVEAYPFQLHRKSGEVIAAKQWLIELDLGGVPHLLGALVDVSYEVELAETDERFRQIADNIREVFWMRDVQQDKLIYVSPAYELIWGREIASLWLNPRQWSEAIHPDDQERVRKTVAEKQDTKGYDERFRVIRPDGTQRWVRDRAYPVRDDAGKVTRVIGTAEDITEAVALEDRLRQAQKMEAIGTLAGGVAHDFNNILGAILGNAELARHDVGPDHPAWVSLEEIRKASMRAKGVVQQILAFSRDSKPEKRLLELQHVILDDVKLLRAGLPANVRLHTHVEGIVSSVLADPAQVHQVLLNLSTNAWQAMKGASGEINISVGSVEVNDEQARRLVHIKPGNYVCLSVADTGAGMDEATVRRIFDPFFTTKPPGQGTGLGLAVVHGIVTSHGGAIEVSSEPGSGTTFRIYLPAEAAAAPAAATPGDPSARGDGKHVLYLDDEEALVFLVKRMLGRLGYKVTALTRADAALKALEADPKDFDLVVTDQNMPGMSGVDFAKAVRERFPDIPVVLASGLVTDELRTQAAAAGVVEVVYKPNTVEDLCAAVHRVIASRPAR